MLGFTLVNTTKLYELENEVDRLINHVRMHAGFADEKGIVANSDGFNTENKMRAAHWTKFNAQCRIFYNLIRELKK